jgi:hypothetical protein
MLLQNAPNNASCFVPHRAIGHNSPSLSTKLLSTQPIQSSSVDTSDTSPLMSQLPNLFPIFSEELISNGFITPTPIQQSSALRAKDGESLLLIAATGSGKTLAYLLPALSRACDNQGSRKTVLICAPTRELSAQLARDASLLLPDEGDTLNVLLAVRSIPPPTPTEIANAQVLIGTPNELYAVLTRISLARNFIAGDTLSSVILDEVDVLLPLAPKTLRTSFDRNDAKNERRAREQKRKLRAAQRRGVEFQGGSNKKAAEGEGQVLSPTEKLLRLIASARFVGGDEKDQVQVLAGSATASRTTLDRLNKALRSAAMEVDIIGSDGLQGAWKGNLKACRPENSIDTGEQQPSTAPEDSTHTIRAVTVPSVVDHRYVFLPKSEVTNSQEILANVAKVIKELKPESSLLFICGEFSRSLLKEKKKEAPKATGKTSQARRDAERRSVFIARQKAKESSGKQSSGPEPLSVRKACSVLQSFGVDAQPMHVVLGLEPNAKEDEMPMMEEEDANDLAEDEVDLPQLLVTFEGSARGLHFDGVDVVFVVGRPTSAASYLHLAGRVGRSMANDGTTSGEVEVRPGTIVSFCSKGRVTELEKWTNQVGGTKLELLHI